MIQSESVRHAAQLFENTKDPLSQIRSLILEHGGFWDDKLAEGSLELFEIHLFGIRGMGFGAINAAEDWLKNAQLMARTEEYFSQETTFAAE